jgi:hypothetical protein
MSMDWQDFAAALTVLASISYLGYRIRQFVTRDKTEGCGGGCRSCDVRSPTNSDSQKPFISLDDLEQPSHRTIRR